MQFPAYVPLTGRSDALTAQQNGFAPGRAITLAQKVAKLAIGLLSIRVLSVLGLVVALWLCPVQTFANLGLYLAAVNLAALAVFGRYELLVIAADDERKCADAFHLCILTGAFAIVVTFAAAVTVQHMFVTYVTLSFTGALFSRAWLRLGLTLATRHGRYQRAVRALLPHAIGQPLVLVYLIANGHNPFLAFVLSDFIGQLIAASCVCWGERRAFHAMVLTPFRFRKISKLASDNLALPTLNLTAAASTLLFATAPLFYLPSVQNGVLAGTLGLLFRLLELPTNVASASLGPVLLKEIADRNRAGMVWASGAAFLLPAAIAIVLFGLISLGGLPINSFELVSSWHMALTILPVVALFQAGITAALPLIDIATLAGRQRGLFALNVAAIALAGAALLVWRADPIFAILVAGSIGFARVMVMSFWLASGGGITLPAR
jgi:hypothetical protein